MPLSEFSLPLDAIEMAVESRGLYFNESHRKLLTLSAGHFKVAKSDFVTILRFVPNPYRSIMKVYGLTGGIGSGKTTIRQLIEALGIPTLDADAIGRELVAPNQPGLVKIVQTFGSDVLTEQGELNRAALRQRILENPDAKHKLEAILHPMIRERTQAAIEQLRRQNPPAIVVEIPLLAETGNPITSTKPSYWICRKPCSCNVHYNAAPCPRRTFGA